MRCNDSCFSYHAFSCKYIHGLILTQKLTLARGGSLHTRAHLTRLLPCLQVYSVGIHMIAFLQEANSSDATLEWDVDFADREHSEMFTGLTRQIEYLQRVSLSVNVTLLACIA